jgi:HK97 family phage major capsid protein
MKTQLNTFLSKNLATILASGRTVDFSKHEANTVDVKALTIGQPTDGDSRATVGLDEQLGAQIMELARSRFAILGLIASKDVSSAAYREFIFQSVPDLLIQVQGEKDNTVIWPLTGTPTYESVSMKVGKLYAKPLISTEAITDPSANIFTHFVTLIVEEFGRNWNHEVIYGDGGVTNIRGLLSASRINPTQSIIADPVTRTKEFFPVILSGVADSLGDADASAANSAHDNLIDMEFYVPSVYQENSAYIMNRNTLKSYRKMSDESGKKFVMFSGGNFLINERIVFLDDFMPNADGTGPKSITEHKSPVIFGDLGQAYAICNVEDKFILDPFSADGGVVIKHTSRKGDLMQRNDAIVVLHSDATFV